ncbi:hypothetical protein DAPPUDRAFT_222617 [Daphnia pulex]|uniref:CRAL-TRIO domain-containing protein n=1 Tax=Daphnia pulex TaxID=6669 RepID=E9G4V2_DAPPU|nr:hypothetical protein DAPPUDRAFT_222617 [Daphnia pulex]|eukprot:EFX85364.1 hypothetical protein DAPPUDRAFT_222617 [Daphnia pulex]
MDLNQFNEKQKAVLKQFREALNDCQLPDSEDVYLIRWLIARDFDLAKAEKMLRNSIEWRRKFKIDALREELKEPEVLSKYFPAGFVGRDKSFNPSMESAIKLIQVYEANYPEYLHRVFVINAPTIFAIGFSMIKPFLNERTRNKIQIFNHDIKQWKAALLTEIDAEELPACYGGKKTDPDGNPNCATLASPVNMGGVVPKSYYFSGKSDTTNKTPLTVANGSKEHVEFQVKRAGDVLKWDFHTEEGDIAFALYKKQDGELIPIVHFDRVDCDMSTEEGELQCDDTGVYVVEFDNNFSYLRSKKIWYSIKVESATARVNGTDLDSP